MIQWKFLQCNLKANQWRKNVCINASHRIERTNPVVAADKTTLYVAIAAVMSAIMAFTWLYKFPSLHYHISTPLPPIPSTSPTVHTKIRRWIAGWLVGWLRCLFDRPTVQTENRLEQNKNTENVKKGNNSNGSRTAKKTTTKTWMYTNKVYFHIHIQCCWLVLNTLKRPTAKLPACLSASRITTAVRNVWFYYSSELI